MKKVLISLLILLLIPGLCACSARTGEKEEKRKGAPENVIVSENPRVKDDSQDSKSEPEPESKPEKDDRPEELASNLLYAARTGERQTIQAYADYNTLFNQSDNQNADWILFQILTRLKYEVLSSKVEDDRATVSAKLTNVDMNVVLPLYFKEAMQLEFDNALSDEPMDSAALDKEYQRIFAGLMTKHEAGKIEKLVDIEVLKTDDKWKIQATGELGNAMLGGYMDAQKSVMINPPQIEAPPVSPEDEQQEEDSEE